MSYSISPDYESYVQAVQEGTRVIYHAEEQALTIFREPFIAAEYDEPYPFHLAELRDPHNDAKRPVGYVFYKLHDYLVTRGGLQVAPYLAQETFTTHMLVSTYSELMRSWNGWSLARNQEYKRQRLEHDRELTDIHMQNSLDANRERNEDILHNMWNDLVDRVLPVHLPSSAFQDALWGRVNKRY